MNGVIIVDKPAGWTSHDVVNRMRRILQQRSVGHLGTLDPLATGVLPLVTGSLTRLAQFYISSEKNYEGVIRFGFATNTYDADGEPLETNVGTAAPGCPSSAARLVFFDTQGNLRPITVVTCLQRPDHRRMSSNRGLASARFTSGGVKCGRC